MYQESSWAIPLQKNQINWPHCLSIYIIQNGYCRQLPHLVMLCHIFLSAVIQYTSWIRVMFHCQEHGRKISSFSGCLHLRCKAQKADVIKALQMYHTIWTGSVSMQREWNIHKITPIHLCVFDKCHCIRNWSYVSCDKWKKKNIRTSFECLLFQLPVVVCLINKPFIYFSHEALNILKWFSWRSTSKISFVLI